MKLYNIHVVNLLKISEWGDICFILTTRLSISSRKLDPCSYRSGWRTDDEGKIAGYEMTSMILVVIFIMHFFCPWGLYLYLHRCLVCDWSISRSHYLDLFICSTARPMLQTGALRRSLCVCVRACARVCVCACVRACVPSVCVRLDHSDWLATHWLASRELRLTESDWLGLTRTDLEGSRVTRVLYQQTGDYLAYLGM